MTDTDVCHYSVSDLFTQAARRLKTEFDYVRNTNPHAATKGSEAEKVLREFLNKHMPQRFKAATGILIDSNNDLSKQTDVIIYDALTSPVYRYSEDAMILPIDTVASVIEVKSRLTGDELLDCYRKIASVKSLKKRPSSEMDLKATGSGLKMSATLGVIFAFTSDISIETAGKKMGELNGQFDPRLWPDMLVLLDVGTVNYVIQSPGGEMSGDLMPREDIFPIAPFYVNLAIRKDADLSLNRFFITLLSHLQFFPHRPSVPPFEIALAGTTTEGIIVCGYQYDRDKNLIPTSRAKIELPAAIQIKKDDGNPLTTLTWLAWPSGGTVTCDRGAPLEMFLALMGFGSGEQIFNCGERKYSSILPVTRADFLRWPQKLNAKMKGMCAEVVVLKQGPVFDEGTSTPFVARLLAGMHELAQQVLSKEAHASFVHEYPMEQLLRLRKLKRELDKSDRVQEELATALLESAAAVAKQIFGLVKNMGVNASFLLYRDPAFMRGVEELRDKDFGQYLSQHRTEWAKTLAEYLNGSAGMRNKLIQTVTGSDLALIYNGVAVLSEELLVYALQIKAQAGIKIRELEKSKRDAIFQRRFTTDLTDNWRLTFGGIDFDAL